MAKGNRFQASASSDAVSASLIPEDEEMKIFLKLVKTMALEVKRSERIKDIKAKIQDKESISGMIQGLYYDGKKLEDDHTMVDYGIQRYSTLDLFFQRAVGMKLFVRLPPDQRTIELEVDAQDFVQNIKAMIQKQEGIANDCFTLIYSGRKLQDNWTLAANDIQNEATLQLIFNPRDVMSLSVKKPCGQSMRLEVKMLYTIRDVKAILQCMTGIPIYQQKLLYAKQQLVDDRTLAHYRITEESVIEMLPPSFQIFVKPWSGKTITVEVESSNTVDDVMAKVNQKITCPTSEWHLLFAGKMLKEHASLGSYLIQKDSTLSLVISPSSLIRPITIYARARGVQKSELVELAVIPSSTTVHKLKAKIQNLTAVSPTKLFCNATELVDSEKTLADYGIWKETTIEFSTKKS